MELKTHIDTAIAAHGIWKSKLRSAIGAGGSELSPATVGRDDQCEFGKWLHGITDIQTKNSPSYKECATLHRRFHEAAGKVLSLAIAKKSGEAEQMMARGGQFAAASADLTVAMMRWKDGLK